MYERPRVNVKVKRGSTLTYTRDLRHNVYFIYACKIYVRTHGKITRQWKSTLRRNAEKVHLFTSRYLDRLNVMHCHCCGRQEEPAFLISRFLLRMRRTHVASIRLDFH